MDLPQPNPPGGAAAFTILLIIHILNKRRYKTVHWGAVHLLEDIIKKNNQRIRLEQLLLLLMRIAIPIILALCLARPVLRGLQQFMGDEKLSSVILLDNSFSMQAGAAAGSNYNRARTEIGKIAETMPKGSDTSIILIGGEPKPIFDDPTTALDAVPDRLASTKDGGDPAQISEALGASAGELERMGHAAREVVLVSDFQARDWADAEASARSAALRRLEELPIKPTITLFRIADGERENVAIESVDVSAIVLGVGQKASLRVNLRNYGKSAHPDLMVNMKVDGEQARQSRVSLAAEGTAQVLFTHTFEKPGTHTIEINADADALKGDNEFFAVFPVWDEVPAVLVNGKPSNEPLEGETDFLEIALQPFGAAKAKDLNDLIKTRVIQTGQLNDGELRQAHVAVLANAADIGDHQIRQLEEFVYDGGGLIIFGGDNCRLDWYNDNFFSGGNGLLPMPYAGYAGPGEGAREGGARIVNQHFEHPALAFFNDPRNGKLGEAEFRRWLRMEPTAALGKALAASLQRKTSVLCRLDTGDPLIIERQMGDGRIIQCAMPADADWTNLPLQPFYVPLMQRLVTYLAAAVDPPRNLSVDGSIQAFLPREQDGKEAKLADPAGKEHILQARAEGSRAKVEFPGPLTPGIYTLTDSAGAVQHLPPTSPAPKVRSRCSPTSSSKPSLRRWTPRSAASTNTPPSTKSAASGKKSGNRSSGRSSSSSLAKSSSSSGSRGGSFGVSCYPLLVISY
ncbi:MAG: BatA domain-containing protein [Verrucomicrobiales bacterium]